MQASIEHPLPDTRHIINLVPIERAIPTIDGSSAPLGNKARNLFRDLHLFRSARHPPVRAAFYTGLQELTILGAVFYLLAVAGRPVKRATGRPLWRQGVDMLKLWFGQRIDPPSYYAQDLYKPDHLKLAGHYLTRYETKNGLMITLNTLRPKPFPGHEMNDKALFSELCQSAGIAHAETLARSENGKVTWFAEQESIRFDLFCKPRKGMGAKGTLAFRHIGEGRFADSTGQIMNLAGVEARLGEHKSSMLVQRWLRNHPGLSDLAKDSLLAVRVITCLNERDEPEVCLAMLRILTVLEPEWQHLPDGEYASPIDLPTGRMGRLAGDSMRTSPVRQDNHPANGAQIAGRMLPKWQEIADLACRTHAAVPHRIAIGWDIAITPEGPVMLEGNTNFDVMFLQRVHDAPASQSRFGELLDFHLEGLRQARSAN